MNVPVKDRRYTTDLVPVAEAGNVDVKVVATPGEVAVVFNRPLEAIKLDPRQARRLAEAIRQASHRAEPSRAGG